MTVTQKKIMQLIVDSHTPVSQAEIQEKVGEATYVDTLFLFREGYIQYPSNKSTHFIKGPVKWE